MLTSLNRPLFELSRRVDGAHKSSHNNDLLTVTDGPVIVAGSGRAAVSQLLQHTVDGHSNPTAAAPTAARGMASQRGCTDPLQALELQQQQARHVTEIHFGKRNQTKIHPNFCLFGNLETLWLNNNELSDVVGLLPSPPPSGHQPHDDNNNNNNNRHDRSSNKAAAATTAAPENIQKSINNALDEEHQAGSYAGSLNGTGTFGKSTNNVADSIAGMGGGSHLHATADRLAERPQGCFRLRRLYLSNNRITKLVGDIQRLKFLEVLLLANNRLSNMEVVSKQLAPLKILKQLDLFGNPLSEELNYRLYFIHNHPSLELFDRLSVKSEERTEAAIVVGQKREKQGEVDASSPKNRLYFGKAIPLDVLERQPESMTAAAGARSGRRGTTVSSKASKSGNRAGTTTAPSSACGPMLSASVQLLEAKVKHLKIKHEIDKKNEEMKEERLMDVMAARRAAFHRVWGNEKKVQELRDKHMSALYDPNDNVTPMGQLLTAAVELHSILDKSTAQAQELTALIAKLKRAIVPERDSDCFSSVFLTSKTATLVEDRQQQDAKTIAAIFGPADVAAMGKVFDTGKISTNELAGFLKIIGAQSLDSSDFLRHVSEVVGTAPDIDLKDAQIAAARYLPLLRLRVAQLYEEAKAALGKNNSEAANVLFKRSNALNDQVAILSATQTAINNNKRQVSSSSSSKKASSAAPSSTTAAPQPPAAWSGANLGSYFRK